jgi:Uncharacterised protein family (UPF0220)
LSEGAYGGEPSIVWRARLFLFIGFALMAGGLAGGIVRPVSANLCQTLMVNVCLPCPQSVLVLKYIIPAYESRFVYYGLANVCQNVSLMLSAVVLWLAQHAPSDYEYNLQL